ncbi:SMI1/KNR4 family protein [Streptomyces sp. NBC_00280]|uniref:SMI1/KNR4 family protein n=1 Tax=Streptomyces sp. NBC_00280 TaxID=2975699 RepID=UPI003250D042
MSSIHEFATWEPLLRLIRAANAESLAAPGGYVTGQITQGSWSVPIRRPSPPPGQAAQFDEDEYYSVQRLQGALAEADADAISFVAEISPAGRTVLHLLGPGPAVEPGIGTPHPGALVLVEDAVAEPWRRLPRPVPGARPALSADPVALERTLRERIPDAVGATEAEIAAAEARLGVALPDELKALYRVTRARWEDWGEDYEAADLVFEAVGCELFPLDDLFIADVSTRDCDWRFAANVAVVTRSDATVQDLVGSPGWIVFGGDGGGDHYAVDLTPGPRGHTGQVITLSRSAHTDADLVADSLTDLVLNRHSQESGDASDNESGGRREDESAVVARVGSESLDSVQAAAHPELEVLHISVWGREPVSLAPVTGLPRLRTLTVYPGSLADPLEIAELTGLEFLELAPEDWRVLLDAGAVPRSLLAASIEIHGDRHPLPVVALANELLALWSRPPITRTVLEGHLGPLA